MKTLNEKDFEIVKWALDFEQIDEITSKGMISLTKEQIIETLKKSIKLTEETRKQILESEMDDEMIDKIIEGGKLRQKEEQDLIERLENDNEEYEVRLMKGSRED